MPSCAIKICCISSLEEAQMAIAHGASAIGLVGPMPSGPGIISDELIAHIASQIPKSIQSFLLTSETATAQIIAHHRKTRTTTIQLVDALQEGTYADLREALPGVKLVQVLHVLGMESIQEAKALEGKVDAILLDSGNPNLMVKELGGTGRIHDWGVSQEIVKAVQTPVYLAGGLNPGNAAKAIETVRPYGLDLCSGLRTEGHLEEAKVKAFFTAVHSAAD